MARTQPQKFSADLGCCGRLSKRTQEGVNDSEERRILPGAEDLGYILKTKASNTAYWSLVIYRAWSVR